MRGVKCEGVRGDKVSNHMNIVYPLQSYTLTHTLQTHHTHPHTLTVSPSSSFQESLTLQDIPQFPKSGEERRVERREGRMRRGGREVRVSRGGGRGGREGRIGEEGEGRMRRGGGGKDEERREEGKGSRGGEEGGVLI